MSFLKKEIEFELNLIPFIDMLSACLSFLLLTAVWTYIGSIDTTQAIGAESTHGQNNPPSVVVSIDKDNNFDFDLKDTSFSQKKFRVSALAGEAQWQKIDNLLVSIKKNIPALKTSVILTKPGVTYGITMHIVDSLKKADIKDVGLSPM